MRDLRAFVRAHVAPLALPVATEQKIVDEWAAQLEDAYDAFVAGGHSADEAWALLRNQLPDLNVLGRELLDDQPVIVRLASPHAAPWAGDARRSRLDAMREHLTRGLGADLRAAVKRVATDRAFSAAVILTLAICLGANAAVFAVVQGVLLRPLPIPDADRVVAMGDVYPTLSPDDVLSNDAPSYFDRRRALTTLEEQALFTFWFDTVQIDGVPQEVRGMRATPSLFRLLRVTPALGRTFTDDDGEAGADTKVILSHGLWQRLYGGDPTVVGREMRLGWTGQPYTIVGVMPRDFTFFELGSDGHVRATGHSTQFWIPLAFTPEQKTDSARTRYGFYHLGRLRPDATVAQVREQLDALNAANFARLPQFAFADLGMYTAVTPLQDALTRPVRRVLYLLWGAAGFVLLIGAINIANLALARSIARVRELQTRIALGARRVQVIRQLVIEGLVPALAGGAAGVAVGAVLLRLLGADDLAHLPNATGVGLNGLVTGAIVAAAALVGAIIGLVHATGLRVAGMHHALTHGSRFATGGRASRLFRRGLVIAQVALSVILLISAALLLTSFQRLLAVDAGFTATHVATATIFPPPSRYPDSAAGTRLFDRVLETVRAIPGVEVAGITSNIALSGRTSPATVSAAGRPPQPGEAVLLPSVVAVTPGYFEAMRTRLLRGRYFTDADRAGAELVAIVDARLARRLWPDEDPIGKAIQRGQSPPYRVVGVVADIQFERLAGGTDSLGAAYFPHAQAPPMGRLRWLAIRTAADPAAVLDAARLALTKIDPDLPLSDMQAMTERTSRSLSSQRIAMRLATVFGVVALFLSMLGVYGVLSSAVAQRTREIGVRLALGSTVAGVFHLVFREGATLISAGLMVGVMGAVAAGRTLQDQLFGVEPTSPGILGAVAVAAGLIAMLACVAPALRATRVDPVRALQDNG